MDNSRKEKFRSRFNEHYSRLCAIAYSYVSDTDDSEDIVQELFINIWDKGKDSLSDSDFAAYITTAVKNSCISFLRKKCSYTISMDDNPAIGAEAAGTLDYDTSDDERERKSPEELLNEVLDILPPKCKEIFLLSKLKGLKYKEIAEKLSLSEKTVENQMGKALKLLREYAAKNSIIISIIIFLAISYELFW